MLCIGFCDVNSAVLFGGHMMMMMMMIIKGIFFNRHFMFESRSTYMHSMYVVHSNQRCNNTNQLTQRWTIQEANLFFCPSFFHFHSWFWLDVTLDTWVVRKREEAASCRSVESSSAERASRQLQVCWVVKCSEPAASFRSVMYADFLPTLTGVQVPLQYIRTNL